MTKINFMEIMTTVVRGSRNAYSDRPAIRQLFHELKDTYNRAGQLTESQAQRWVLTPKEESKLYKGNF